MNICILKWSEERQGYVCSCGAFYEREKGWRPPVAWCMKCHGFFIMEKENENVD